MDWPTTIEKVTDPALAHILSSALKSAWCDERHGWRVAMPLTLRGRWQDVIDLLEDRDAVRQLRAAQIYSLGTVAGGKFVELRVGGGKV